MTSDSLNLERNEVRIIGRISEFNLGADYNKRGSVVMMTVVTKKKVVNGDVEYLDTAVIPVTILEAAPLLASRDLKVGDIVSLEGRIRTFGGDCRFDVYATKIEKL